MGIVDGTLIFQGRNDKLTSLATGSWQIATGAVNKFPILLFAHLSSVDTSGMLLSLPVVCDVHQNVLHEDPQILQ